ncbi:hypothetical protein Cgig2_030298 [Carnegiea gigantea]|uniref:Uncharacterized protein n=1 Tax=Carnegiea gigantea TaxID=171969 RepID=A0A9Q1JQF0_9CARY|nr:hypothetical protein Cgig2_030298 [Carnegiea gigantea]
MAKPRGVGGGGDELEGLDDTDEIKDLADWNSGIIVGQEGSQNELNRSKGLPSKVDKKAQMKTLHPPELVGTEVSPMWRLVFIRRVDYVVEFGCAITTDDHIPIVVAEHAPKVATNPEKIGGSLIKTNMEEQANEEDGNPKPIVVAVCAVSMPKRPAAELRFQKCFLLEEANTLIDGLGTERSMESAKTY